ncbi:MAG: hypothetical protein Q9209_000142 [Squamulea sp. 1 TL-2023]
MAYNVCYNLKRVDLITVSSVLNFKSSEHNVLLEWIVTTAPPLASHSLYANSRLLDSLLQRNLLQSPDGSCICFHGSSQKIWPNHKLRYEFKDDASKEALKDILSEAWKLWTPEDGYSVNKDYIDLEESTDDDALEITATQDPATGTTVGYGKDRGTPSCRMKFGTGNNYGFLDSKSNMAHELGHALGLYLEHQRSDRDAHVLFNSDIARINAMYGPTLNTRNDDTIKKYCGPKAKTEDTYDANGADPVSDPEDTTELQGGDDATETTDQGPSPTALEGPPKQTLQISQFVRKDPKDGGDAGKYFISAGVTKPNDKYPGGANEGSSSGPQPAKEDSISFTVKLDGDGGETHDVIIITPPLDGGQPVDEVVNAPLTIKGFPTSES